MTDIGFILLVSTCKTKGTLPLANVFKRFNSWVINIAYITWGLKKLLLKSKSNVAPKARYQQTETEHFFIASLVVLDNQMNWEMPILEMLKKGLVWAELHRDRENWKHFFQSDVVYYVRLQWRMIPACPEAGEKYPSSRSHHISCHAKIHLLNNFFLLLLLRLTVICILL